MPGNSAASSKLLQMLSGYRVVQAIYAGAQLGIADLLKDGPRDGTDLAHATGAHADSIRRLLRALVSLEVLEMTSDGRFALAPIGELLRSDAPGSLRAAVLFYGGRRHWTAWGQLVDSVKAGSTAFGGRSPNSFLEMAARDPEGARIFNEAMASLTAPVNASVVAAYDFSGIGTLVDVGGGYGALLSGILLANPGLRGVLFDIPTVIDGARQRIDPGLAGRLETIAGNAFESVPSGGDAYILKWVVHDWSDELSTSILGNCRAAMRSGGKLLLVERVMSLHPEPSPNDQNTCLADLNMLLLTGGRERSADEYRTLLGTAGFKLERIVRTTTPHCIIEAIPA